LGALRASPLLANGAEAEAVAEAREAADDVAEEVVREVGPAGAAPERAWHDDRRWLQEMTRLLRSIKNWE